MCPVAAATASPISFVITKPHPLENVCSLNKASKFIFRKLCIGFFHLEFVVLWALLCLLKKSVNSKQCL
jgi:hypothetical protein